MIKFENMKKNYGPAVFHKSHERLFGIGGGSDICIMKKNKKEKSFCWVCDNYYNYKGLKCPLIGGGYNKTCFTPKRFVVIQMK